MEDETQAQGQEEDEEQERGPVTVLELAYFRLSIPADEQGSLNGADFVRADDLPIIGGCEVCGATVAAYNSCPSQTGYLRCRNGCIADLGYATVEEANRALFPDEYVWKGVAPRE